MSASARLDKVKALYLGATTDGERAAAAAAIMRILRVMVAIDRRIRRTIRRRVCIVHGLDLYEQTWMRRQLDKHAASVRSASASHIS